MLNRRTSLTMVGGFLLLAGAAGACDEETTATTSNPSATTGTQSGGGGAGADGGTSSVGGAGGAGAAGGGGVTNATNANCEAPSGTPGNLTTVEVANGFTFPVAVTSSWGDGERLYVIEKAGTIQLVKEGVVTEFLNIIDRVQSGGANDERGLLGLAFHPNYVDNGRFFVHYSNGNSGLPNVGNSDTVIEEYRRDPSNPDLADANPVRLIIDVDQPFGNHNGGSIHFSPLDGYLWIGLGDGGSGFDPNGNGQNKNTLLGALSRLDVDGAPPYVAPTGNITDGAPEIYDWGLRNPYRWSFDICTGDRYIGDVGQNCWEEISIAASDAGNINWGWSTMEANQCTDPDGQANGLECNLTPPGDCDNTGMEAASVQIPRSSANSITGGHVYRGSAIPWLRGAYIYADFAQGNTWMLRWEGGSVTEGPTDVTGQIGVSNPSGFGLDNDGELYVLSYSGSLHRIEAE